MVNEKIVSGWDDPRLHSVMGLKRRGYTSSAINEFCDIIGVTRSGNDKFISIKLLEFCIRKELEQTASRDFAVLDPVKLEIVNLENKAEEIKAPLFPLDPAKGHRTYKLTKTVFIEKDDFREEPTLGFWGLCPGQPIILKYGPIVLVKEIVKKNGVVDHVKVEVQKEWAKKVKGVVHWVAADQSINAEVRIIDHLFTVEQPLNFDDDWIKYINPESLVVMPNAKLWSSLKGAKEYDTYQFERLGFFCVDKDSTKSKLVMNRIVSLVESKLKKDMKK